MGGISLTASMRSNLLNLQNISGQVSSTQNKLATGNKVNSAIDNPSSYYTARSLNNRADDLNALLDSMGQAVSTIKAATEGIESATELLEQMRAVTEQTLTEAEMKPVSKVSKMEDNSAELIAQGYIAITADMSIDEINAILATDNAKVVLAEDVTLNSTVTINGDNVIINGGGHNLSIRNLNFYGEGASIENVEITSSIPTTATLSSVIYSQRGIKITNVEIKQENSCSLVSAIETHGSSTIENVDIEMTSNDAAQISGINVWGESSINNVSISIKGGTNTIIAAIGSHSENVIIKDIGFFANGGTSYGVIGPVKGIETNSIGGRGNFPSALYDGKANTQAIVAELGKEALAAYAATQFYVGDKNGDFGQGSWYLPAIGEWMNAYGTNIDKITGALGSNSGVIGDGKIAINNTLSELEKYGIAEKLTSNNYYITSTEYSDKYIWRFSISNGERYINDKAGSRCVRVFSEVKGVFKQGENKPQIGDIMYSDKTWGSAADYDGSKTAVGVVTEISEDGTVKIMNLKDLTFNSTTNPDNFSPDNPYSGSQSSTTWTVSNKTTENISGVEDFSDFKMLLALNPNAQVVSVEDLNAAFARPAAEEYQSQYNEILSQYNALIKDSSYKGVNLLNGGSLSVKFNEDNTASLSVQGKDISSGSIGLKLADWAEKEGILQSVQELSGAIFALRSYSSELGNNYNIITTRQDFTESLVNVLTEGADKLTLADMNEESANMLALQTRQQLAINSISLASQASQSILKLF